MRTNRPRRQTPGRRPRSICRRTVLAEHPKTAAASFSVPIRRCGEASDDMKVSLPGALAPRQGRPSVLVGTELIQEELIPATGRQETWGDLRFRCRTPGAGIKSDALTAVYS